MVVSNSVRRLLRRDNTTNTQQQQKPNHSVELIIAIAIVLGLVGAVITFLWLTNWLDTRRRRVKTEAKPKPSFLARFRSVSARGRYSAHLQPSALLPSSSALTSETTETLPASTSDIEHANPHHTSTTTLTPATTNTTTAAPAATATTTLTTTATTTPATATTTDTNARVDRNTSVRSVMTLPVYSPNATATEQVIGREGDRAGIDVVVEHPESFDEEEARREQEMNSLYLIREARRTEAEARENRSRCRREARERGDVAELTRIQEEARAERVSRAQGMNLSNQLIAEHQLRPRPQPKVAAVSYYDVGQVRHDGTRLRASSMDSTAAEENGSLLSSAAPLGGHGRDASIASSSHRSSVSSHLSQSPSTSMVDLPPPPTYSNIVSEQERQQRSPNPPPYVTSVLIPTTAPSTTVPKIQITYSVSPVMGSSPFLEESY